MEYYGNTPPGDYYGWDAVPQHPPESYGLNDVIKMEGNHDPGYSNSYVSGGSVTKARSGIWIHGGREQTGYTVTNGCVRIHNDDIKVITDYMKNWISAGYHTTGRVSITR